MLMAPQAVPLRPGPHFLLTLTSGMRYTSNCKHPHATLHIAATSLSVFTARPRPLTQRPLCTRLRMARSFDSAELRLCLSWLHKAPVIGEAPR